MIAGAAFRGLTFAALSFARLSLTVALCWFVLTLGAVAQTDPLPNAQQDLVIPDFGPSPQLPIPNAQQPDPVQSQTGLGRFDHGFTGFPLDGAHAAATCESCHLNGNLTNAPATCVGCHDGGIAAGKTPAHPPASDQCSQCHTTADWKPFAFDHTNVTGACVDCHNGDTARGKSDAHLATTDVCNDCHIVSFWAPAMFNHAAAIGECVDPGPV